MKKLLAFLLSFSLLNVCIAQEDSLAYKPKTFERIGLYTTLRLEFSPESRLNPLLRQNGYPEIPNSVLKYGLGVQYRMRNWVIRGEVVYDDEVWRKEDEKTAIGRRVFSTNLLLSYYLKKIDIYKGSKKIYLYPFIGFSRDRTALHLKRPSTSKPVNPLFASPDGNLHLKHRTYGFNVGIGADLHKFYDEDNEESFILNIKIGYRASVNGAVPWQASTTIPDVADHFNPFFVQLNIGLLGIGIGQ